MKTKAGFPLFAFLALFLSGGSAEGLPRSPEELASHLEAFVVSGQGVVYPDEDAFYVQPRGTGLPSQVCLERFTGANPPLAENGGRVILIDSSIVGNDQDDIGIYSLDAPSAITNGVQFLHVLYQTLLDYSE